MTSLPIYLVTRYPFTARPDCGETVAEGLTREAASALASSLRAEDPGHAYGIRTMSLEAQEALTLPAFRMAA